MPLDDRDLQARVVAVIPGIITCLLGIMGIMMDAGNIGYFSPPVAAESDVHLSVLAAWLEQEALLKTLAHMQGRGPSLPWRYNVDEDGDPTGELIASYMERALAFYDDRTFRTVFRMGKETFRVLLRELDLPSYGGPRLHHRGGAGGHNRHPPATRLGLTLYILAHGCTETEASATFSIPSSTVHRLFTETLEYIGMKLKNKYVIWPDHGRQKMLHETWYTWCGILGVVGAVDGTYIKVKKPKTKEHPVKFFCRKQFRAINLQAVCDFDGRFTYYFYGWHGAKSDWKALRGSPLGRTLDATYGLYGVNNPYLIKHGILLGDSGYWPRPWLLVPFNRGPNGYLPPDQDVYNYRHSSGRIIIEQAFGTLKGRWRIMHKGINCDLANVPLIMDACMTLHNFMLHHEAHHYTPTAEEIDEWAGMQDPINVPVDGIEGPTAGGRGGQGQNNVDSSDDEGNDVAPVGLEDDEVTQYSLGLREAQKKAVLGNPAVAHKRRRYKSEVFGV